MPTPSSLPRDPRQTPRTRRFMQKLAEGVFNNTLPIPPNVPLVNTPNTFTAKQQINAFFSPIHTDTDAATITFDMNVSNLHIVTLGGDRTLAVTNVSDGQWFTVILVQDAGAPRLVTWWANIKWSGGVVPTLTATANKEDVFEFLRISATEYLGFTAGLNF